MARPMASSDPTTKETLLKAAKKLFARRGLSGTSIRDIADEAQINSSMISYYFGGKSGLYRACLQEIASTRLQFTRDLLIPPLHFEEYRLRLKMFAESFLRLFLEDRDLGLIIIREYDRIHSPAERVFKENFLGIIDTIVRFFSEAVSRNFVDSSFDPFILANLYFSSLTGQLRLDHINEKAYGRTLKDPAEREKISSLLTAIFTRLQPSQNQP